MAVEKLEKRKRPYHYTESGLSRIWLVDIYEDQDGDPVIPNLVQLHQEIAKSVALQRRRLEGEEIRFLRTHIGFSGADFARKILKVTPETVSRWENNRQTMDLTTEVLLRMMVLKEIKFHNYAVEDLSNLDESSEIRWKAKYSAKGRRWQVAA